jgi:hypothetical protein
MLSSEKNKHMYMCNNVIKLEIKLNELVCVRIVILFRVSTNHIAFKIISAMSEDLSKHMSYRIIDMTSLSTVFQLVFTNKIDQLR